MTELMLRPFEKPFNTTIAPPGSKSLTNRALVLAALADGECEIANVLLADDTQVMLDNLGRLGFSLSIDPDARSVRIKGENGRIPNCQATLFCGNSGTTIRFLTALCALGEGTFILDGVPRMRQRPIGPLTMMLRNLGARVEHPAGAEGFPPVHVMGKGLPGGLVRYGSEISSQYLSAVLMVAPYAKHEVQVDLDGPQTSWPYVAMTMQLMDSFHHLVELERDPDTGEPRRITVPRGTYKATRYDVEPDASAATYFLASAAVHPGAKVTINGLGKRSLQGDVAFADVMHQMGAHLVFGREFVTVIGTDRLDGIDVDMSSMPDAAMTLATAAVLAKGETVIRGLHTLRLKETDRLAALQTELTKLGATVEIEDDDVLVIQPPAQIQPASIDTYDDHRMAMSFAVIGTRVPGITIRDPACTSKTYPEFFSDLEKLRA